MSIKLSFSIIYGLLFSFVGLVVGLIILLTTPNDDYNGFFLPASIGAFLTAWSLSRLFLKRVNQFTTIRITWVSILVGLLSHWACWYIVVIILNFDYWVLDESLLGSYFDTPIDPLNGLYSVFAFCLWSWMLYGWITVPYSVATAFLARYYDEKKNERGAVDNQA